MAKKGEMFWPSVPSQREEGEWNDMQMLVHTSVIVGSSIVIINVIFIPGMILTAFSFRESLAGLIHITPHST